MNICNDSCRLLPNVKKGWGRTTNLTKRCTTCEIRIDTESNICPCCKHVLRTKSHKGNKTTSLNKGNEK